jgi:hypothetical protein
MTEDEIGKQVIDVETTIDFLAFLASWREYKYFGSGKDFPGKRRRRSIVFPGFIMRLALTASEILPTDSPEEPEI